MKILFNPDSGAVIKNIWYKDELFLSEKENQAFVPGMVIRVDDDFGSYLLDLLGFLRELSASEAKKYLESQEEFKCDKCDYKTKIRIAYYGHKRKHDAEARVDELGIQTIVSTKHTENQAGEQIDNQKKWDEEDKKEGLVGEGLVDEK